MAVNIPETPRSLQGKVGKVETIKGAMSLGVLGLAAATVHRSQYMLQATAAWALTVSILNFPVAITGFLFWDKGCPALARCMLGLSTILWLTAAIPMSVVAVESNDSLWSKRSEDSLVIRRWKVKISAAGWTGPTIWACIICCVMNFFGCLMQWYYDMKATRLLKAQRDPEAVLLDDQQPQ